MIKPESNLCTYYYFFNLINLFICNYKASTVLAIDCDYVLRIG